jgi:hypothetical protein
MIGFSGCRVKTGFTIEEMRGDTDDSDIAYCRRPFVLRQEQVDKERNPIRNDGALNPSAPDTIVTDAKAMRKINANGDLPK